MVGNQDLFNKEMESYLDDVSKGNSNYYSNDGFDERRTSADKDMVLKTYPDTYETKPTGFDKFIAYLKSLGQGSVSETDKDELEGELENEFEEEMHEVEVEKEKLAEEDERLERKRENIIVSFLKSLNLLKDLEEENDSEDVPSDQVERDLMVADMKRVGKEALEAIKKMPKDELETYKNSEEFKQLKETLKRYNIIKEI